MIVPSANRIEDEWLDGNHKFIAKWLPYFFGKEDNTVLINNLLKSNLLQIKDKLLLPPLTLGADPEFILCERQNPDKIVMFSSAIAGEQSKFSISEAEIGADYGLLELRCEPVKTARNLANAFIDLQAEFKESFTGLSIVKK